MHDVISTGYFLSIPWGFREWPLPLGGRIGSRYSLLVMKDDKGGKRTEKLPPGSLERAG